jgi:hypothetical protein
MRRWKRFLMIVGPIAILVVAGAIWLWTGANSPGVNESSFFRIRIGMTVAEVEAILGEQPAVAHDLNPDADRVNILPIAIWERGHTLICVYFDKESRRVHHALMDEPGWEALLIAPDERTDDDPYWRLRRLWKRLVPW